MMKQILHSCALRIFSMLCLLSLPLAPVVAQSYPASSYKLDDTGKVLVEWKGYEAIINMQTDPVLSQLTGIAVFAFYDRSSPVSITLPDGLTIIGYDAFRGCSSLASITLPESLTSIGERAFYGCSSLASISLPDSLTSIGESTFYGCSSLTSIKIPEKVTSIGESAFAGCSSLASIKIPEKVISIGESAFAGCSSLASIKIPEKVISIGESAFAGCSSLTKIKVDEKNQYYKDIDGILSTKDGSTIILCPRAKAGAINIPKGVTDIGYQAFFGCSSLVSVSLPDDLTAIGKEAFRGCSSLVSISLPDDLTAIGESAFSDCSSLTSIKIPEKVTSIGYGAFYGCSSLTSIKIPEKVTDIGYQAFSGCRSLTKIEVDEKNHSYKDINGILSTKDGSTILSCPNAKAGAINIPKGVTSISYDAFVDCSSLVSISLPDGLTSIGNYAFSGCSSLVSISLPEGLTSIGRGAFRDCRSLASIKIPEKVTDIGHQAFYGCSSLTSISLPKSLTSISFSAFSGCTSLVSITLPEGLTSIDESAFSGCTSLASITLPEGLTSIDESAFSGCSSLTSLRIPKTVQKIGSEIIQNSGVQTVFYYLDEPLKGVDSKTFGIQPRSYFYLAPEVLYVPQGKLNAYVLAGWDKYFGKIVEMDAPDAKYRISLKIEGEGDVQAQDEAGNKIDPATARAFGSTTVLTPIPEEGNIFLNWVVYNEATGESSSKSTPTLGITYTADTEVKALFRSRPKLTTEVSGGEATLKLYVGEQEVSSAYIFQDADKGKEVKVLATIDPGYKVEGWYVNGSHISGSADKTYQVVKFDGSNDLSFRLKLQPYTYPLTFEAGEHGKISATNKDRPISSGAAVDYKTDVVFTAIPNEHYSVRHWLLNGESVVGTDLTYTHNMRRRATVRVEFELSRYTITFGTAEYGTFRIQKDGVDIKSGDQFVYGTVLSVETNPDELYQVESIRVNGKKIEGKIFKPQANSLVEVSFALQTFAVKTSVQGEGTIAIKGFEDLTKVPHGTELSVAATAKEGWELSQLTANGVDITAAKKFVVTKATTVVATFVKQTFAVKTSVQGEGTIAIKGFEDLTKVPHGTELSVTATAKEGWELSQLTANGADITAAKKFVVTKATTVVATFVKQTFAVKTSVQGEGTIAITGFEDLTKVPHGTELSVTATAKEGWELSQLTANGADITAAKKFVVTKATTVVATFVKQTFAVKTSVQGEGTIAIKGFEDLTKVPHGTELSVTATAKEGWELSQLTANGADITAAKKFVVTKATTVVATFVKQTFAVTLKMNEHGTITLAEKIDPKAVPYGTELTVVAKPKNDKSKLIKLTANGVDIIATKKFVVMKATEIIAEFADYTSIEGAQGASLKIYPNPAKDFVQIQGAPAAAIVHLYGLDGRLVLIANADTDGAIRLNVSALAAGEYLLVIGSERRKLIIE